MSKNKFYPQTYKCPDCGTIQDHYVWSNEIKTATPLCVNLRCPVGVFDDGLTFENLYEKPKIDLPGIKTDTKNRFGR